MKKDLGDTPPEIFREQLHRLADWIADYRGKIETLRVAPDSKPGAIRAALPAQPPEQGEPFEKILADVDRVILPGMVHWSHPHVPRVLRLDHDRAGNPQRNDLRAVERERDDMAHFARRRPSSKLW